MVMLLPSSLLLLFLSLIGAPSQTATAEDNARSVCQPVYDFTNGSTVKEWQTTNDGVMGGKSKGGPVEGVNSLLFTGATNTDGGGFSSIKAPIPKRAGRGIRSFKLKYRGDGRDYLFNAETGERRFVFFRLQYWADLPTTGGDTWQEITLPLTAFTPHHMGDPVRTKGLRNRRIKHVGFYIYDKNDGPFDLEIAWIKACYGKTDTAI